MSAATHLRLDGSTIRFADRQAQPEDFSIALTRYLSPKRRTRRTLEFEQQGSELAAAGFKDDGALTDFVKTVCWWGRYSGIAGRVLKENDLDKIRARLSAAKAAVEQEIPDLQTAIREVRALKELGLSFASKHLRLLWPQHCPVLDSQLHEQLGYPMNSTGYITFAQDCREVAAHLKGKGVSNPARDGQPQWYVADVEAAVFVLLDN